MAQYKDILHIKPDAGLDWQYWVERWDRMQERYLVRRSERFDLIVRLLRETQPSRSRILDLGCGTGSLVAVLLEAFPQAEVFGVDFDPTVLLLARERLQGSAVHRYGNRARLLFADLRNESWWEGVPQPVDAVVSATALHWLLPEQLAALYHQLARMLRPGGMLINADHVGSESASIQKAWERGREEMRRQESHAREGAPPADDWDGFWAAYTQVLGLQDADETRKRVPSGWEGGIEDGLPLAWHFDRLREAGFEAVDCFWRCDCDAVYGGVKSGK